MQLLAGAAVVTPLAVLVEGGLPLPGTTTGLAALAWLAAVNSVGAVTLLFVLLRRGTGAGVSGLPYLVPAVTAVLAVPVLGQPSLRRPSPVSRSPWSAWCRWTGTAAPGRRPGSPRRRPRSDGGECPLPWTRGTADGGSGMDERVLVCFGDSNTHGTLPWAGPDRAPRFGPDVRWPGQLAAALGAGWRVHEEGLPGRTTVHADPVEGEHLCGLAALPMVLGTHSPVDLLVVKLGTNDLKARFAVGASDIALSVERLVRAARAYCRETERPVPRVLVVAPAPITEVGDLREMFRGGAEKSARLGGLLREVAARLDTAFVDAGEHVRTSAVDGIHLDGDAHRALAAALAPAVRDAVPAPGRPRDPGRQEHPADVQGQQGAPAGPSVP